MQRLRTLSSQRADGFAYLGRKLFCAFGQLGKFELVRPRLKHNFPGIRIEADAIHICQPPLKALRSGGQHGQVTLEQPNLRRPRSLTQGECSLKSRSLLQIFQQETLESTVSIRIEQIV